MFTSYLCSLQSVFMLASQVSLRGSVEIDDVQSDLSVSIVRIMTIRFKYQLSIDIGVIII